MPGRILFRKANLIMDNLGINALAYASPVLSLVWLAVMGEIQVARLDLLLVGMGLILGANLFIHIPVGRWAALRQGLLS